MMKNFPHQFNNLEKLFNALLVIKELIEEEMPLKDENFGELLTRKAIYTYKNRSLFVEEFLTQEEKKPKSNRGYLTAARDIRRLFQLLGFLTIFDNKSGELSPTAIQLISAPTSEIKKELWKNAFMQLGLEGTDGEISHPYRILLKLVQNHTGIETSKLMLALEAENDSYEEFQRVNNLTIQSLDHIIQKIGISEFMARNAVKILPAVAEQLGDIKRINNQAYPVGKIIITEDEIATEIPDQAKNKQGISYSQFRKVNASDIAKDPIFNEVSSISIDLAESIRIRQDRLSLHQEIVRKLGLLCEKQRLELFEGKFDCLATIKNTALLFEVKTIRDNFSDQEKQTVKGVGQLKYYNFSIVQKQMEFAHGQEFIVYSQKPSANLISFCHAENINVIWTEDEKFKIINSRTKNTYDFTPVKHIQSAF